MAQTLQEAKELLRQSAKYIAKGVESGAYAATVGGDLFAERLYEQIHRFSKASTARLADARDLLKRAAQYISKGLEMGVYAPTVGGDLFAERLLERIHRHTGAKGTRSHARRNAQASKSPAQLDREIAEALTKPNLSRRRGSRAHSTMLSPQQGPGVDQFWNMYEEELVDSVAKSPGDYALQTDEPPEVYAKRIRESFQKHAETSGLGQINLDSNTFKRLARRLGIKKFSQRALKDAYANKGGKK